MNNTAIILNKINEERNETNIKDEKLKKELEVLLDNICIQKIKENIYTFFKFFASKKKGILYFLLLTGDKLDGIYEFKVFGHNVKFKKIILNNEPTIRIDTISNYDLAEFDVKDVLTIIEKNNDLQFKNILINLCLH